VVFSTPGMIQQFHAEVNGDPAAEVTPWTADGQRSVTFRMPLKVPAMVQKLIGSDCIRVVEVCKVTWLANGSFEAASTPCLDVSVVRIRSLEKSGIS
jgi:hypothetical protein